MKITLFSLLLVSVFSFAVINPQKGPTGFLALKEKKDKNEVQKILNISAKNSREKEPKRLEKNIREEKKEMKRKERRRPIKTIIPKNRGRRENENIKEEFDLKKVRKELKFKFGDSQIISHSPFDYFGKRPHPPFHHLEKRRHHPLFNEFDKKPHHHFDASSSF